MRAANQTLDGRPVDLKDPSRMEPTKSAAASLPESVVLGLADGLFAWLTGLCRDRDRAADLTQECFAAWWATADRATIANPRAWLFRTARNLFLADVRRLRRTRAGSLDDDGEQDGSASLFPALSDRYVGPEESDRVRAAVFDLPHPLREPIVLRYWCELPDAEIAAVLRIPLFVVRWRIHKGKAWLRTQLTTLDSSGGDNHVPR